MGWLEFGIKKQPDNPSPRPFRHMQEWGVRTSGVSVQSRLGFLEPEKQLIQAQVASALNKGLELCIFQVFLSLWPLCISCSLSAVGISE